MALTTLKDLPGFTAFYCTLSSNKTVLVSTLPLYLALKSTLSYTVMDESAALLSVKPIANSDSV